MSLTKEQQDVVDYISTNNDLVLVSAVAGSGKTTMLKAIADTLPHTNSLNLCYNKAIATSAKIKFPSTTYCSTVHSLAYQAVVIPNKLKVGTFNYRSIKEKGMKYEHKCRLVNLIREFCLSKHTTVASFAKKELLLKKEQSLMDKYLTLLASGKIEISHDFYLKLFHLKLKSKEIEYEPFDFIMIDEAGDLNEVTLEVFKLLPSPKKIAVGDPHQNIYAFNHTINCFTELKGQGTLFPLTETFRTTKEIARSVEVFCRKYLNPNMHFRSNQEMDDTIVTKAYISRSNPTLINEMIKLNEQNISYGLVRFASTIFKLPLMVANIKYQHFISEPEYTHLQVDYDEWYENEKLQVKYKTPLGYIANLYEDDFQLCFAIDLVNKYGKKGLFDAYYEAKKHENKKQNLILTTAHSSKG